MDGRVGFEPKEGEGSSFWLNCPWRRLRTSLFAPPLRSSRLPSSLANRHLNRRKWAPIWRVARLEIRIPFALFQLPAQKLFKLIPFCHLMGYSPHHKVGASLPE